MLNDNEISTVAELGWGIVAAFEKDKINQFVKQVQIIRYKTSDALPPVSGVLDGSGGEWRYKIESFLMDRPGMFFESTGMNDARANMTMRVLSGYQMDEKLVNGRWYAQKIEYFSPARGPLLRLDLRLPDTPIEVDVDGTLFLDLKDSDNFSLELTDSDDENKNAGDFFQKFFKGLDDAKRRYPFGKLDQKGSGSWPMARKAYMRTQRNLAPDNDSNGAVVLFIQVGDEPKGVLPDGSGMEYLLRSGETVRVIFSRYTYAMPLLVEDLTKVYNGKNVQLIKDSRSRPVQLKMTIPSLVQPARTLGYDALWYPPGSYADIASCDWRTGAFGTADGQEISFVVGEKGIVGSALHCSADVPVSEVVIGGRRYAEYLGDDYDKWAKFVNEQAPRLVKVNLNMHISYRKIGAEPSIYYVASSRDSALVSSDDRDKGKQSVGGDLQNPASPSNPAEFFRRAVEWVNFGATYWGLKGALFSGYVARLKNNTKTEGKLDFVSEMIRMNFGEAIHIQDASMMMDGDVRGWISPELTTFVIDTLEVMIGAGDKHNFTVSPVTSNIEWTLDDPSRSGKLGSIEIESGIYTAPDAADIEGLFTHVRVTARHKDTGFRSSALVTVLKHSLVVNPLIDSTPGLERTLKAGVSGSASESLTWSIKNTGTQGSLDTTIGSTVVYTPSKNFGADPDTIFVVDEITVSNGKESATSYIVNRKSDPVNVIAYTVNGNNTVQCQATVNGKNLPAKWKVLVGPGEIDSDSGLYTADPTATQRFVLIYSRATLVTEFVTLNFDGYLILPLPLAEQDRALPGTVEVSSAGEILREIRPMN